MKKNELLSGMDNLKVDEALKQNILKRVKEDNNQPINKHAPNWLRIALPACFVVVAIVGVFVFTQINSSQIEINSSHAQANSPILQSDKFEILENPPENISSIFRDYSPLSEVSVVKVADIIVYAQVENIKWIRKKNIDLVDNSKPLSLESMLRCRTILTLKLTKVYKGDAKKGETLEIMLPVAIPGKGEGDDYLFIEDNSIVSKIKKHSTAFFFINDNKSPKAYIGDNVIDPEFNDICRYSTSWGEESVILRQGDKYIYSSSFESLQNSNATFKQIESMIKKYIN